MGLDNPASQPLTQASVIMSNWNGWDPNGPGVATAGYQHEFTLELYEVDRTSGSAQAGSLIAEVTELQDVAARELPGATPTSGNGTDFLMSWDLSGLGITASELLFIVSFEITDDPTTTFDEAQALSSMNIAAADVDTGLDVTAGTDTNSDIFWRASATGGSIASFNGSTFADGIAGGGQVFSRFTAVPTPSAAAMLGLGGLIAARRRRG